MGRRCGGGGKSCLWIDRIVVLHLSAETVGFGLPGRIQSSLGVDSCSQTAFIWEGSAEEMQVC